MNEKQLEPERMSDADQTQPALPEDFESALAELEALVAQMESGAMDLEDSLKAYQRGVQLAKVCQARLQHVEQQVQVLQDELLTPWTEDPDATSGA